MEGFARSALTIGAAALFAGCGPQVTVFTPSAGALAQPRFRICKRKYSCAGTPD